jgi:phosphoglycerol geranylgeranyltransferase
MSGIYDYIIRKKKKGEKLFCVLIDPDKFKPAVIRESNKHKIDLFFVGGSEVRKKDFESCVNYIKKHSKIPLVIFPGSTEQVSPEADALLFLSLISGRNAEFLIGKQTRSAMAVRKSKIETIPTGYILVNGGKKSSTEKVTGTTAIPVTDEKLIVSTAIAGELLGLKLIYIEAGSGARTSAPQKLIKKIRSQISVPLIAGGGITDGKTAAKLLGAGADLIVVGNGIENNLNLIKEISSLLKR